MELPIIDISALDNGDNSQEVADEIRMACMQTGFFYIAGHGVSESLQLELESASKAFFAQDLESKMRIRMALGGKAWRGYFPVGDELTSGKPDLKEGLYFGEELDALDPRVIAGTPMHGANLFPGNSPRLREAVLAYIDALTGLGHRLMRGISMSLGLDAGYFHDHYTANPVTLFRIFHYPAQATPRADEWGVGEHTDYGVLTILRQDDVGGLQVKTPDGWIEAPPIPNTFVCNIGDMLDRITRGLYRSTPHRVLNRSGRGRMSFPFFFDPAFDAEVRPLDFPQSLIPEEDREARWDKLSVHAFEGTYGEYLLQKVGKVFPDL